MKEEILNKLKEKLIQVNKDLGIVMTEEFFGPATINEKNRQYYLKNIKYNLIEEISERHLKEYTEGNGNELNKKMCAIQSSSAMTFNLLGNDSLKIKDINTYGLKGGIYKVYYESKLEAIKSDNMSSHKANIDAKLKSEDDTEYIFCEMKMLEWLSSPKLLKRAYLNTDNYFFEDTSKKFIDTFKDIIDENSEKNGTYKSKFSKYDAIQMLIHALGIYNACRKGDFRNAKKITLLNCVWSYEQATQYQTEEAEYNQFKGYLIKHNINKLFLENGLNIDFDIKYITVKEFIKLMEKTERELKYISRYEI